MSRNGACAIDGIGVINEVEVVKEDRRDVVRTASCTVTALILSIYCVPVRDIIATNAVRTTVQDVVRTTSRRSSFVTVISFRSFFRYCSFVFCRAFVIVLSVLFFR